MKCPDCGGKNADIDSFGMIGSQSVIYFYCPDCDEVFKLQMKKYELGEEKT